MGQQFKILISSSSTLTLTTTTATTITIIIIPLLVLLLLLNVKRLFDVFNHFLVALLVNVSLRFTVSMCVRHAESNKLLTCISSSNIQPL